MGSGFPSCVDPGSSPWKSTREMLKDVFADLLDSSVREFLLRTPPAVDIAVLTTPGCISKGISSTRSFGGTSSLSVVLVVPTHRMDNLAFGISVESYAPSNFVLSSIRTTELLFHFVLNGRKTQALSIAQDHRNGLVCVRYRADGGSVGAQFQFHLEPFLSSFGKGIDLDCLQRALIRSHVLYVRHVWQGPSELPADTGSFLRGENLPPEYHSYFAPRNVFLRTISTQYSLGCPVRIEPIIALVCRNYGTHRGAVDLMTTWAVRNTLQVASSVLKAPISRNEEEVKKKSNKSKSAKPIAPAKNTYVPGRPMSYAEKINAMVDPKKEHRKIMKRIAAMKNNEKKRVMLDVD